jgi:O-antigen/teichoic acid export membrane protein
LGGEEQLFRMIRGGFLLSGGNVATALLGLARNILIARFISVEDFGVASTFAITMAMVEMGSNMSLDRLVVQARDGEEPALLSTLHGIQAVRGMLGTLVLFLVAGPLSSLFGVPEIAWAYQVLAVTPLLRGFSHLDMFRRQREMQFLPSMGVEVSAQFLSTAAALPLAYVLGDYRAMLYVLVIQQLVFAAASHWVAVRPYRWAWNRDIMRRAIGFGWPLLVNGILMFGILQGDRVIIGSLIGMTELGWYSAAFTLTLMAAMVLVRIMHTFFLPQLARVQDDEVEFERLYLVTIQATLVVGLGIALGFAILGPSMLVLLYGEKYGPAVAIIAWLAIAQGLRVARAGPAIVAIAKGNTTNPLLTNIARVLVLPVAWVAVSMGAGIIELVGLAILGEAVALAVTLLLLHRKLRLPLSNLVAPLVTSFGAIALIAFQPYARTAELGVARVESIDVAVSVAVLVACWSMRELREWTKALIVHA